MTILDVAVAAPVFKTYSYELPHDRQDFLEPLPLNLIGCRVFVPFGKRKITGYVIGFHTENGPGRELKEIEDLLDDEPLFHQEMVDLFKWVADYYHYPLGMVIQTALPGGLTVQAQKIIRLQRETGLLETPEANSFNNGISWLKKLAKQGALTPGESKKVMSSSSDMKLLMPLVESGLVSIASMRSRELVRKKTETCYLLMEQGRRFCRQSGHLSKRGEQALPDDTLILTKGERKTLHCAWTISQELNNQLIPRKELQARYPYSVRVVSQLMKKNLLEKREKRVLRTPFGDLLPYLEAPEHLTDEQRSAISRIVRSIESQRHETVLLHGITGSGKTEVYLKAAEHALHLGKRVLVLVPEIALATQIEAHFVSRFGSNIALLHSGLSAGERYDEWERTCRGKRSIVIGARSAVFAPLRNIGLIIVDEEHDSGYKQEDQLRYNSRDIAILRGKMCKAVTVLGSATPAITSYHHAQSNKFKLIEMKNRVGTSELPKISVVDLKIKENRATLFSKTLVQALQRTYKQGNQSILLLNRRGFSASVICRDCGSMIECKHCNVTLNMHKLRKSLVCHYCGFNLPLQISCTTCGSEKLVPVGFGTERVEEEVFKLLPEARIARLDSDVASDRKRFMSILQSVRDGKTDILIGTQMIAKGLHFPGVTLVGVVWADGGLAFPDFRAAERTFQLIAQVTGRAGRGQVPGEVIIQTMQPLHYAVRLAATHDYQRMAEKELAIRKEVYYPPFARLVSLRIEGESEKRVRDCAFEVAAQARSWSKPDRERNVLQILGPAPAPIERIKNVYRWQVLLKSNDLPLLHGLAKSIMTTVKTGRNEKLIVDVDPENML